LNEKIKFDDVNKHQLEEYFKQVRKEFISIYVISIFFPILYLIFIPWFVLIIKPQYIDIKQLRDDKEEKLLLKKLETVQSDYAYPFVIYALFDIKYTGLMNLITEEISKISKQSPYSKTSVTKLIHLGEVLRMIKSNESRKIESRSDLEITKVYFIDKEPKEVKCIITKLLLDFSKKEIVICPICHSFAEKNSLEDWLKENSFCPICKTVLTINDFPLVILKK
jgi:hypothetical protein